MPVEHDLVTPNEKPPRFLCGFFVFQSLTTATRTHLHMPLPKPPATRAALLSAADYESQSAPKTSRRSPERPRNRSQKILDLHDDRAGHGRRQGSRARDARRARDRPRGARARADDRARPAREGARGLSDRAGPGGQGQGQAPAVPASARARAAPPKLFVLDTNVLLHDPTSLFRFEEHDVYLPMITLEELDNHKKGMTEVARNARQVSRDLDGLATDGSLDPVAGIPLSKTGHRESGGKLFFQTQFLDAKAPSGLPQGKADNQILAVVQALRELHAPREVVLVSKDINMRVKARALGLPAEDYFNDKTLDDADLLYTGVLALPARLLGQARQDDGELEPGRPHVLPHRRPAGALAADQPVRLPRDPRAPRRCTRASPRSRASRPC